MRRKPDQEKKEEKVENLKCSRTSAAAQLLILEPARTTAHGTGAALASPLGLVTVLLQVIQFVILKYFP